MINVGIVGCGFVGRANFFHQQSNCFSMFFFWSGLNSIGIDEVDVGFYPEARLRGKADSYNIRDVVSTRTKVFLRFLLNNFCDIRDICVRLNNRICKISCPQGIGEIKLGLSLPRLKVPVLLHYIKARTGLTRI